MAKSVYVFLLLLVAVSLSSCRGDGDRVVPPTSPSSAVTSRAEQRRALVVALDSLEALVVTLERVEDPISAWNRAEKISRLLRYLERNQSAYALGMNETDAARQYPAEIDRLKRLETRRDIEMNRILSDPVIARVLAEEMAEADTTR